MEAFDKDDLEEKNKPEKPPEKTMIRNLPKKLNVFIHPP
jgi:hypothetical protein